MNIIKNLTIRLSLYSLMFGIKMYKTMMLSLRNIIHMMSCFSMYMRMYNIGSGQVVL